MVPQVEILLWGVSPQQGKVRAGYCKHVVALVSRPPGGATDTKFESAEYRRGGAAMFGNVHSYAA